MTLIVAATGKHTIWISADRRLTSHGGSAEDIGRKLLCLSTDDGKALLGYAGLGRTASGTEPSDWMKRVLRGRRTTLERSLGIIANALSERMPPHLDELSRFTIAKHAIVAPAIVDGKPRIYGIGLEPDAATKYRLVYQRIGFQKAIRGVPTWLDHRIVATGSGWLRFAQKLKPRHLLTLLDEFEAGRVSELAVATEFARLNTSVADEEPSVGPSTIVLWRAKDGVKNIPGGGVHQFRRLERTDVDVLLVPDIGRGTDWSAVFEIMKEHTMPAMMAFHLTGVPYEPDKDAINALLAQLPTIPDDTLK